MPDGELYMILIPFASFESKLCICYLLMMYYIQCVKYERCRKMSADANIYVGKSPRQNRCVNRENDIRASALKLLARTHPFRIVIIAYLQQWQKIIPHASCTIYAKYVYFYTRTCQSERLSAKVVRFSCFLSTIHIAYKDVLEKAYE